MRPDIPLGRMEHPTIPTVTMACQAIIQTIHFQVLQDLAETDGQIRIAAPAEKEETVVEPLKATAWAVPVVAGAILARAALATGAKEVAQLKESVEKAAMADVPLSQLATVEMAVSRRIAKVEMVVMEETLATAWEAMEETAAPPPILPVETAAWGDEDFSPAMAEMVAAPPMGLAVRAVSVAFQFLASETAEVLSPVR